MTPRLYALVAYVHHPVGEFAINLRRELHPEHPDWPAHLTILPPRHIGASEEEALRTVEDVCSRVEPFEVAMGDVETFVPITPTVFIRVAHAAYRLRELHDLLNSDGLSINEPWPYMPHLTIAKLGDVASARRLVEVARQRWREYSGSRRIPLDQLTFVREGNGADWEDIAVVRLGKRAVLK